MLVVPLVLLASCDRSFSPAAATAYYGPRGERQHLTALTEDLEALKSAGQVARYELEAGHVNLYIDRLTTGATLSLKLRLKARGKVKTQGSSSLAYLYYHPEVRASAAPTPIVVN